MLIWGELVFVPATLALILAGTMPELTMLVGLFGLTGALVFTAVASVSPYLTTDERELERINSYVETAAMLAFVLGPAAGALTVRLAGIDWIFVLDAATSAVAVAAVAGVGLREVVRADRLPALHELREGFRFSYAKRQLRFYLFVGTATWMSFGLFAALEPIFYREVLGVGPDTLGWVLSVFGLGLVAGSLLLPRLPAGTVSARFLTVVAASGGGAAVVYVGTDRLPVVVTGAVLWGILLGLLFPMLRTLIHFNTPEHLVGRIMGTVQAHNQVGELLPLIFAAALAALWGVQPVLIGSGVALILVCLLGLAEAAGLDRIRGRPVAVGQRFESRDEPISPIP